MLNILYIVQPYYIGGAEIALLNIIKNLNPAMFNQIVLFPAEAEAAQLFKSHKINTKIIPIKKWEGSKKWFLDFIKDNRIDIVYTNTPRIFGAAIAAKLAGIKHIWHMHSRLDSVYPHSKPAEIRKTLELIHLLSAKIIVCSGYVRAQFEEIGLKNKVVKVNCGIDLKDFDYSPGRRRENFLVGMASRIDPQKRPQDFIKAAGLVKKRFPKVKFALIGASPNREYILKVKKINSSCGNPVDILGFCKDMPDVMRSLDILVLPSVGDASPLVILEAMACAKPVIAVDSGGVPEIVIDGKTGILVPPKRPLALAGAIADLVNEPDRARLMGSFGLARAEKYYNITETTQKLQGILLS